jgi:hypothetical protein
MFTTALLFREGVPIGIGGAERTLLGGDNPA